MTGVNRGRIDRVSLKERVRELSKQYLREINDTYITLFANEAKKIVDNTFDDFVIAQETEYTSDSVHAITDKKALLEFTDAQNGYRRQMQDWVNEHPIEVKKQEISIDDLPTDIPFMERESLKRSMSTLGIGTMAVVGLKFLTGTNWLYLGELAILALSAQQYKVGVVADEKQLKLNRKKWAEVKTNNIIDLVIRDLDQWLDEAEQGNLRVIKSFNL